MKNIIYTIVDEKFYKFFKYFYHSLKKVNPNIDLLCITPENLNIKLSGVLQFKLKNFDCKFTAKFKIIEWEKYNEYDNYLFLDADIYFLSDPIDIFNVINKQKDKLHGVKEDLSLNQASQTFYNFNRSIFNPDVPCFNAGNFGFHKDFKNKLKDYLIFTEENRSAAEMDQSLMNVFFYGLIKDTLSPYIEIYETVKPIKPKIVHFAGFSYRKEGKEDIYQRFFKKANRFGSLCFLPEKSNAGLFNCSEYFEKENINVMRRERGKEINVYKNEYNVENEFYDYVYIENASSINELIEIIRKIYPKVKGGGVITSVMGGEAGKNVLKKFITKSGLDFFQCYEDDIFFTIKL